MESKESKRPLICLGHAMPVPLGLNLAETCCSTAVSTLRPINLRTCGDIHRRVANGRGSEDRAPPRSMQHGDHLASRLYEIYQVAGRNLLHGSILPEIFGSLAEITRQATSTISGSLISQTGQIRRSSHSM